jgi:hypothetical protein
MSAAGCGLGFTAASVAAVVKGRHLQYDVPLGLQAGMFTSMIVAYVSGTGLQ